MQLNSIVSIGAFALAAISTPILVLAQAQPYGTSRVPQSCPSRLEPRKGPISAKQAEKYFTCHIERGESFTGAPGTDANFITDLKIQVASKSRRATMADINRAASLGTPIGVNESKPVYEIKGSYTSHFCSRYPKPVASKTNCIRTVFPASQGICFQSNFDEWHCLLTGKRGTSTRDREPPQ